MNIIKKAEKTIKVKGTAKRKAHKRKITFEGKVKDPVQFEFLSVTGINELDQKISFTMHDFEKRIANDEDMREAIKGMVDSQSKMYYTKIGIDDPKTDIIMNNLSKIVGITNKSLTSDLVINIMESGRSNYNTNRKTINVSNAKDLSKHIYHEYGHHLEASKQSIHQAVVKFYNKRTLNEPEVKLNNLIPGIGYDDEITKKNHFIHPYIGKIYDKNMSSTEILSWGIEQFTNSKAMEFFYNSDRDHFALCLTALSGRI